MRGWWIGSVHGGVFQLERLLKFGGLHHVCTPISSTFNGSKAFLDKILDPQIITRA